jgi:GntR family transcriptional regulator
MLFTKPNPTLGVPIYFQIIEQVKHGISTGALKPGDQLPGIRVLAEQLVINPNTVAKVYRELEFEGLIEVRHGAGAFIADQGHSRSHTTKMLDAQNAVRVLVEKLQRRGLSDEDIRRAFEAELITKR